MTYKLTTLSNGLRIATDYQPHAKSVTIAATVGVGSVHENKDEKGLAHFVEHMMFKGTKSRGNGDIMNDFNMLGADANALTDNEVTAYRVSMLPERSAQAMAILSDMLENSTFDATELRREQGTVLNEIRKNKDNPEVILSEAFYDKTFTGHPLASPIIGTKNHVRNFTSADLKRFVHKHYTPDNIIFTAAGNIRHDDFVAMVKASYSPAKHPEHHPQRHVNHRRQFKSTRYQGGVRRIIRGLEQAHFVLGLPTVTRNSPEEPALEIYSKILATRLFWEIREKHGMAYSIDTGPDMYDGIGLLEISSAPTPRQTPKVIRILLKNIEKMKDGVSEDELTSAKEQLRRAAVMASEAPLTVALAIGEQLFLRGKYTPPREETAKLDSVTQQDVTRIAEQIAAGSPTLAMIGARHSGLKTKELQALLSEQSHPRIGSRNASGGQARR